MLPAAGGQLCRYLIDYQLCAHDDAPWFTLQASDANRLQQLSAGFAKNWQVGLHGGYGNTGCTVKGQQNNL